MGFALPDLDRETIDELILSIHEALDEVEPALDQLSHNPNQPEILNDLFRNLHTIKGNFRMCFLEPFTDYVHEVEETVSEVRNGRLQFCPTLKEALLFGLDKLRQYMDLLRNEGECDVEDMKRFGSYFQQLAATSPERLEALAIELFDLNRQQTSSASASANDITTDNPEQDLEFFKNTALKLDQRLPNRSGHTEQLLSLAEKLLDLLSDTVSRDQFYAAVYLHDIGLGLISAQLLVEPCAEYNDKYRNHPRVGFQYLARNPHWQEAATIILQHHEHLDGSGYPQGLSATEIHPGALLLNMLSNFFELVETYRPQGEKRSVLKALTDINRDGGSRYGEAMVTALVEAIRNHYLK